MLLANSIEGNIEELTDKVNRLTTITDGLIDKLVGFGIAVITAIIIFVLGKIALNLVRKLISKLLNKSKIDIGVIKFIDSLIKFIGYIIIIITICGQIGIETTSLITVLGTAGLSIGLALQGSLSNFAGGVIILVTKPFKVGDYISINDKEGIVDKIDMVYTTLHTWENQTIKIPNGIVANAVIKNDTYNDTVRVDVPVNINYNQDVEQARQVILQIVNSNDMNLKEKEPVVVVTKLDDSAVALELRAWCKPEDRYAFDAQLKEDIKAGFAEIGIEIPYSQLVVHVAEKER